jgi:hypothetical protein
MAALPSGGHVGSGHGEVWGGAHEVHEVEAEMVHAREGRKRGAEQGWRQRTAIAAMPEVGKMATVDYYLGENGG